MPDREEIEQFRRAVYENGYQPIAVRTRSKVPVAEGWVDYIGIPPYEARAENTGIITDGLAVVDIDIDDPGLVHIVGLVIEGVLGQTPLKRGRGNSSRVAWVYREPSRMPRETIAIAGGKIDILGKGQQLVVHGLHDTGVPYVWFGEHTPANFSRGQLPTVTAEMSVELKTILERRWPVERKARSAAAKNRKKKVDLRNTLLPKDVRAAIEDLPNDYERDDWIRLGMAMRVAGATFVMFDRWSRKHASYSADDTRKAWDSFDDVRDLTAAALFGEAFNRLPDWKKPSEGGTPSLRKAARLKAARTAQQDSGPEKETEARSSFDSDDAWAEEREESRAETRTDRVEEDEEDWTGTQSPEEDEEESDFECTPPLPLFPEAEPAAPFPVDALGPLAAPALAIAEAVQVDPALAAQSVLLAANLAVTAHANVVPPSGAERPIELNIFTVGESGERKTSSDKLALRGIRDYERLRRNEQPMAKRQHRNAVALHEAATRRIKNDKDLTDNEKMAQLMALHEPVPPTLPFIMSVDMTMEGFVKLMSQGLLLPLHAWSTSEGGSFVGGAAMGRDFKTRTISALSRFWDGEGDIRMRAGDGGLDANGKRLCVHILLQPNYITHLVNDDESRSQGFLSRLLIAWPESRIGRRPFREASIEANREIEDFRQRIFALLQRPLPLFPDTLDLNPRLLPIARKTAAWTVWIDYHNWIESELQQYSRYFERRDIGAKSPEQAARLAAVLALFEDPEVPVVPDLAMRNGIRLAHWYLEEAMRLDRMGLFNSELNDAATLLEWLWRRPERRTFREVLQFGPRASRSKSRALVLFKVLIEHGWLHWNDPLNPWGKGGYFTVRPETDRRM